MAALQRSRQCLIPLLSIAFMVISCRPAQAIDPASIGIRTFDSDGQQIGGVNVVITYLSGQYPVEPLLITTEPVGLDSRSVLPNTYSIVALNDDLEPIPESEIILTAPPGAHDIVVDVILPPPCPADLDGDGAVAAAELAQLLGGWGPNPGHPADFNGDGVVDAADLAQLLGDWGPC